MIYSGCMSKEEVHVRVTGHCPEGSVDPPSLPGCPYHVGKQYHQQCSTHHLQQVVLREGKCLSQNGPTSIAYMEIWSRGRLATLHHR